MNFDLNDEQAMLRDLVERFLADHYDPVRRLAYVAQPDGFASENWMTLAETGLLALPLSEEMGGLGGGAVELITLMEALGRGVAVEPVLPVVMMGAAIIDRGGDDAMREAVLPAVVRGERFPVLAHMERSGRFMPGAIATRVSDVDGQARINGEKICVLGGSFADLLLVSALDDAGGGSVLLVEAGSAGVSRVHYRLVDGSVASDIRFDNAVGKPLQRGGAALAVVLDQSRLAIAAELMGLMTRIFDATVDYVKTREQFGQPIGRFQAIQHRLADCYALVELSRSQLYRAAAQMPGTDAAHAAIVGAKAFISSSATTVAEEAVQLHGGIGTTEELMVGQAFKRVLLLTRLLGDVDHDLRSYTQCRQAA
ncbi:alkylation response protein AidB-like acyl-CoA dehydrogenase [Sphingobium fontiphilum]|uniref:Alkylation response protein AidB-like acyl-CoA dehydrogenase n=1 Tax=Sphingobium fontiphilum TaxID=944425 RepID=A0A7W6DI75_9SPHN|nr:alkylation response protein AidB-like acyl-CoA dehydrogenase [Sphingobium fontiphilum]